MRRGIEPVGGDAHIAPHSRVSGKAPLCKGGCHGIAVTGGLFPRIDWVLTTGVGCGMFVLETGLPVVISPSCDAASGGDPVSF